MTSEEYFNWLNKFETKKTTDDCFTPPQVYDAVLDYVDKHIISLDGKKVVRPFYPNGDYQKDAESYDENTIVIDNPPFSMSSKIYDFYSLRGIQFFLFAPALTVFNCTKTHNHTAIIAPAVITYANGAKIHTSFVTNMLGDVRAMTAPELYLALKNLEEQKPTLPKYQYPPNVLMVNDLQKLCKAGIEFEVSTTKSEHIDQLDNQKLYKKKLFGGGLLVSDDKVKELQAKELQAKDKVFIWELSDREGAIVEKLGASND